MTVIGVVPCTHQTLSERPATVREGLPHRSVHDLAGYRRLSLMPSITAASGALP